MNKDYLKIIEQTTKDILIEHITLIQDEMQGLIPAGSAKERKAELDAELKALDDTYHQGDHDVQESND